MSTMPEAPRFEGLDHVSAAPPAPGVLDRIVARTRLDVAARQERRPLAKLEEQLARARRPARSGTGPRDLAAALAGGRASRRPRLIAEFKPRSPSRGPLRENPRVEEMAAFYRPYAAAISVLCDRPFFGGGLGQLSAMRAIVDQPVLCKDFIVGRYQLLEARLAGADSALLMASVLAPEELTRLLAAARELGMEPLVEVHSAQELGHAVAAGARVIGVNARNLRTLEFDRAAQRALLAQVPDEAVKVAESGVETAEHLDALAGLADAVLIGSTLMAAEQPAQVIEQLGFPRRRG